MFNLIESLKCIMKNNKLDINLKLKILTNDGDTVIGQYGGFTQALDNEPEIASIEIDNGNYNIELYENEIKSIEVI